MLNAFVLGAVSQVSLIVSGLIVFLVAVPKRLVGALAAFGAGALIAAVARDLLPEAHALQLVQASLWALLGAVTFIVGEDYVDRRFGSEGGAAGALGIVVGAVVDGVPESIIFGIQLASGAPVSAAFLAAVFVSNIPQAIAPSADLATSGWNSRRVAGLWSWVVLACGVASVLGYGAVRVVTAVHGARMAAFASGGILAMLSNSLIPFAHERSRGAGLKEVFALAVAFEHPPAQ
jgi:ZIP family zinc transporter